MLRFNIPVTKVQKLEDGRLLVAGVMTSETLDSQGDILDYDGGGDGGSKEAITFWEGNLREAHKATEPCGRRITVLPNDKERNIYVETFVSKGAPNTQEKVLDKTLGYFSVGGDPPEKFKIEKRDGKDVRRITKWKMRELSLVDIGANRDAAIQLVKADGTMTDQVADEAVAVAPPPADPPPPEPNRLAEKLRAALEKGKPAASADVNVDNVAKIGNADDGGDGFAEKKCDKCDKFHKEGIVECNTKAESKPETVKANEPPVVVPPPVVTEPPKPEEKAEPVPALTKADLDAAVAAIIEKLGIQKSDNSFTKADGDDLAEAVGSGLRAIQQETSEAIGEIKAALGDLNALREGVQKIAKQPAMPMPPLDLRGLKPGAGPMLANDNSGEARAQILLKWAGGAPADTRAYMERAASLERGNR
jgi:hypothetical protein